MAVKIHIDESRWVLMELATVNDQLEIMDLPEAATSGARVERIRFLRDLFRRRTVETSWGGEVGDLTMEQMTGILQPWLRAREDDAVPPPSGTSSVMPRRVRRSAARTAKRR